MQPDDHAGLACGPMDEEVRAPFSLDSDDVMDFDQVQVEIPADAEEELNLLLGEGEDSLHLVLEDSTEESNDSMVQEEYNYMDVPGKTYI